MRYVKVFLLAHFTQAPVWRVEYRHKQQSVLLPYAEARHLAYNYRGRMLIDFSYYNPYMR